MKTKLISLLLAIVASVGVSAESGTCGDNLTWDLTDGVLTISGTGEMWNYDYFFDNYAPWYEKRESIQNVIIKDGVTTIGGLAFGECINLKSVTIPDGIVFIGWDAFSNCNNLLTVTIPNSVTSIGNSAFSRCYKLSAIEIPNSVKEIGESVFYNCDSLKSIIIPNSVKEIGRYAFQNCSHLEMVSIGDGLTKIDKYTFSGCYNLISIAIGREVSSIDNTAFEGCSCLKGFDVDENNMNFSEIEGVLSDKDKLTLVLFPEGKSSTYTIPEGVKYIGEHCFADCVNLTSIMFPNTLIEIEEWAFYNCKNLNTIEIPNSLKRIGQHAFSSCKIATLTVPNSVTSIGKDAFYNIRNVVYTGTAEGSPWGAKCVNGFIDGYLIYTDETKTKLMACLPEVMGEIILPSSVTYINESAFKECKGLTMVYIPEGVTQIDSYTFYMCTGLTTITIPDNIKSIGICAFEKCSNLKSVLIGGGVSSIGISAFRGCKNLSSITIPDNIQTIEAYSFEGCTNLLSVVIGKGLSSIGEYSFEWCKSLKSITVDMDNPNYCSIDEVLFNKDNSILICYPANRPNATYEIPIGVVGIEGGAFEYSKNLQSIIIPNTVERVGYSAFYGCESLSSVHISDIATWCEIEFDYYNSNPLYYAHNLYINGEKVNNLYIPNSVYSIGKYAFYNCCELSRIIVGEDVEKIGEEAFADCSAISSVTCYATIPPLLEDDVFKGIDCSAIPLYVPEGTAFLYDFCVQWEDFNPILPIPESPTDVKNVTTPIISQKYLMNGQILIERNGRTYTQTGQEISTHPK